MNFFKNYGLSILLAVLFLTSWVGQGFFQFQEYLQDSQEHNQAPSAWEFTSVFLSATFENWQSEFLQLFTFVVFATYLIHKDSPQSRDGTDEMKKMLKDIKKKLNA